MIKHLIYGIFGLLAASVIALAIYLDKPAPQILTDEAPSLEAVEERQLAAAGEAAGASEELFEVIKVIDGDTLSIQKDGGTETVRMIGINAPETGQCYTGEATAKLKSLVSSGSVALELDPSQGERDKYDRLLAYVFTENGINAAKSLIEGGFAKEYTYSKAYKYQSEFKAAQTSAQAGGRGLWASGVCASAATTSTSPQPAAAAVAPITPKTEPPSVKKEAEPKPKPTVEKEEPEPEEEEEDDPPPSGSYICSSNTYNCTDFATHAEAQAVFDACGGTSNDVHRLDANKDGLACESLP